MEDVRKMTEIEETKEAIRGTLEALATCTATETQEQRDARLQREEELRREAVLKAKYGKVYKVGVTIPVDDEDVVEVSYYFRRPSVPSYDRYIKSAAQLGATKASKVFMLDAIVEEDKDKLTADMEEYPGVAITIGNKLTELLGLTTANLKKL